MGTESTAFEKREAGVTGLRIRLDVTVFDLVPYLLLALLISIIFLKNPRLANMNFVETKANAGFTLVLATVGQTMAILSGGIDLSIGGIISLTNSIAATMMTDAPSSILLWSTIIVLIGLGAGAINGYVVAVMGVAPFITTLATWSIFNGLALFVLEDPGGRVSKPLRELVRSDPLGIPNSIIFVLVIVAAWLLFKRSRWGWQFYAVGSNEENAHLNGIPVVRIKILAYMASGLFAALAGLYRTIDVGIGSPIAGDPFILTSAAAVLIGGASLAGGRGDLISSIIGAFIMLFINDVIFFIGVSSFYTPMVQGLFLIFAVAISALGYRMRQRKAIE